MVRDSAYAKRARTIVVNNVIGSGVGMQAQVMTTRDELASASTTRSRPLVRVDAAPNCHTGGALHFNDLERAAMGQVFEAGEVFIRKHYRAFGDSRCRSALELIEPERLPTSSPAPGALVADGEVRMGVEVDKFGRALAYWIRERHPGDIRVRVGATDRYERVPAGHLPPAHRRPLAADARRAVAAHRRLRKIDDMNEYTGSEVTAARASARTSRRSRRRTAKPTGRRRRRRHAGDGHRAADDPAARARRELTFHNPNRPNTALDPFMRHMLREVAAGCGTSYESLSRDYSQSNYSSSRLALLDDRDLWQDAAAVVDSQLPPPLHKVWLQQAVLAGVVLHPAAVRHRSVEVRGGAVQAARLVVDRPDQGSAAYKEAIKAGLTTSDRVIAQTATAATSKTSSTRSSATTPSSRLRASRSTPTWCRKGREGFHDARARNATTRRHDGEPPSRVFALKRDAG
jgi:lambda family phage portal protein